MSAPLHAVHDVALAEQEFGEIGAVLAGDAGDQCDIFRHNFAWKEACIIERNRCLYLQPAKRLLCSLQSCPCLEEGWTL